MADLATRYLEEHAPKKRSGDADGRLFAALTVPQALPTAHP
jgi:hypothetical protein